MKWICLSLALLFPPEDATRESRQAPARWQSLWKDPLPQRGVCPWSFEAWIDYGGRGAICVRRA